MARQFKVGGRTYDGEQIAAALWTLPGLSAARRRRLVKAGRHTYGHEKISLRHWGEPATLKIGNFCSIAEGVTVFLGGNHRVDWVTTYPFTALPHRWPTAEGMGGHPTTNGDVTIGSDVWVAAGSTIMSGVTIGDGAVIGANSHVVRDVEPYAIVAGNPAQMIRHRFAPEVVAQLLRIRWWDWDDERITANVPLLCDADVERFVRTHVGDAGKDDG